MESTIFSLLGELIMPRLEIGRYTDDPEYVSQIHRLIEDHLVGGFCVFGGTIESVVNSIDELQNIALRIGRIPLIFSADCEFGLPMRLTEGGTEFPDAMAIAKTGEPELAYAAGQAIAREMRTLGLTWNFAPVADVNSNPKNPIINTRAFGDDPETVQVFAVAFMMGLQSEGVAATAKHFPGHGDTSVDSHRELPFINRNWREFNAIELPPFQSLIDAGVMSVMTGHLAAPKLAEHFGSKPETAGYPATLSKSITTNLLRDYLHFDGIIVTDALEMRAIADHFGSGEAAVLAFEAGADILLLPAEARIAYEALVEAVRSGRITEQECRIRHERLHKFRRSLATPTTNLAAFNAMQSDHLKLAKEIADKAIECQGQIKTQGANLLIICDDRPLARKKGERFETLMQPFVKTSQVVTASKWNDSEHSFDENTIIATFHRARGYISNVETTKTLPGIVEEIGSSLEGRGIILKGLILMGSPYLDEAFLSRPQFIIKTYSESAASIEAVVAEIQSVE